MIRWSKRTQPFTRRGYHAFVAGLWLLAVAWVATFIWLWVRWNDAGLWRFAVALVLIILTPSLPSLVERYSSYIAQHEREQPPEAKSS